MLARRVFVFIAGALVVTGTLVSAIRTFVLPRAASDRLGRAVFRMPRRGFWLYTHQRARCCAALDAVMALYAPFGLLLLPIVRLTLVLTGYMAMFWALGVQPWSAAFSVSGSALLTLGFAPVETLFEQTLSFSEAALGLILVALLIACLPTICSAFSRREVAVAALEVRAGSPPAAVALIARFNRNGPAGPAGGSVADPGDVVHRG